MKKILSLACAATIAATSIGMSTASASAVTFPRSVPVSEAAGADVIQVRQRGERRYHDRRGFYRQGQHRYYNGYRGYDHRRAGYRYHNGYWFPAAAFIFGAIIGGALANQPVHAAPGRLSQAHVNWCSAQYRSYRLSDNSFQPYNGPRRQCVSPYSR